MSRRTAVSGAAGAVSRPQRATGSGGADLGAIKRGLLATLRELKQAPFDKRSYLPLHAQVYEAIRQVVGERAVGGTAAALDPFGRLEQLPQLERFILAPEGGLGTAFSQYEAERVPAAVAEARRQLGALGAEALGEEIHALVSKRFVGSDQVYLPATRADLAQLAAVARRARQLDGAAAAKVREALAGHLKPTTGVEVGLGLGKLEVSAAELEKLLAATRG